jgi:cytochrome c553
MSMIRHPRLFHVLPALSLLLLGQLSLPQQPSAAIDFDRDIKPILADRCLRCHGPEKQSGGLRLDQRANLLLGGGSGEPAVVPGKGADSYLIKLVSGQVSKKSMPPTGKKLTAEQIAMLKAWIDQGAKWSGGATDPVEIKPTTKHWSFQPPTAVKPPSVDGPSVRNAVDAFILHKLQQAGLKPAAPADRVTLIRRLYLDVLGLPPTPEQVQQFVADKSPNAYEQLVEEVLASPHYGERMAQHWLDVVRYAETHGFEVNTPRDFAWPYRDYVIAAFNDDLPYDQFVFEQLAGDAVGADAALGFLVAGPQDQVRSPDPVLSGQQRQDELNEIINATSSTFLGLTVSCARCHNHKFDPILQKDYYSLQAVFAGVQYGNRPLGGSDKQSQEQLAALKLKLAGVQEKLFAYEPLAFSGTPRPPVTSKQNVERFKPVEAKFVKFTILATNNGIEPCLDELEIWSAAAPGKAPQNVALASLGAKAMSSGNYPGNPIHKLEHLNDGKYGNEWSWISNQNGKGWVQIELPKTGVLDRIVWGRDRNQKYKDRTPTKYRIEVAAEPGQWQLVASSEDRLPYQPQQPEPAALLDKTVPPGEHEQFKQLLGEAAALAKHVQALSQPKQVFAAVFQQPGPTYRLYRGDPLQKREVVKPDTLSVFGSLGLAVDAPEQQRRIALAKWLTAKENPLTARVMVNRIWQTHFGTGLVATPSDFGAKGSPPSHPELLDWLARRFMDEGWSVKSIHRLILLSATYRQAATPNTPALKVDAQNRLLWRFPTRRLEAEAIRDSILAVSGALDLKMGGPGFNVFQPNTNYKRVYIPKETFGPDEWRRMIYVHKVRMEPDGVFGAFDCPDAGQPAPKRTQSTTAIQALNLFNSSFILQQAEILAKRIEKDVGSEPKKQVERAFQLALCRSPSATEMKACVPVVQEHGLVTLCRVLYNTNEFVFLP